MKTVLILLITIASFFVPTGGISMYGVKINDSRKSLDHIKLKIIAKDEHMIKYRTENGNEFSVTFEKGKVVFMENDWLQDSKSRQPLFSKFLFGQTTLQDIRNRFLTNGFTYKSKGTIKTDTELIELNCFEFDSKNNEVLVVITKTALKEGVKKENMASKLKLDAIIIAEKAYLDRFSGKEKVFGKNYKKIKP